MRIIICFIAVVAIFSIGCKKDNPLACNAFASEIANEATLFSNAATIWANDPTSENCMAYKDAGQKYLNALKRYDGCTFSTQDRASYNESIRQAEDSLDSLVC